LPTSANPTIRSNSPASSSYTRAAPSSPPDATPTRRSSPIPPATAPYTSSDVIAEPLLYVAARAYEQLPDDNWVYDTQYDRESYSNSDGWSGRHRETPQAPPFLSAE
jgi:hypothetical protein